MVFYTCPTYFHSNGKTLTKARSMWDWIEPQIFAITSVLVVQPEDCAEIFQQAHPFATNASLIHAF